MYHNTSTLMEEEPQAAAGEEPEEPGEEPEEAGEEPEEAGEEPEETAEEAAEEAEDTAQETEEAAQETDEKAEEEAHQFCLRIAKALVHKGKLGRPFNASTHTRAHAEAEVAAARAWGKILATLSLESDSVVGSVIMGDEDKHREIFLGAALECMGVDLAEAEGYVRGKRRRTEMPLSDSTEPSVGSADHAATYENSSANSPCASPSTSASACVWFVLGNSGDEHVQLDDLPRKRTREKAREEEQHALLTFEHLSSHHETAAVRVCLRALKLLEGSVLCKSESLLVFAQRVIEQGQDPKTNVILAASVIALAMIQYSSTHSAEQVARHTCTCTATIMGGDNDHVVLVLGHIVRLHVKHEFKVHSLIQELCERVTLQRGHAHAQLYGLTLTSWHVISLLAVVVFLSDQVDSKSKQHLLEYASSLAADACEETLDLLSQELHTLEDEILQLNEASLNFSKLAAFGCSYPTQCLCACANLLERGCVLVTK